MVWVGTDSAKQCFISFESEIAGSRIFWVEKPSSSIVCQKTFLSIFIHCDIWPQLGSETSRMTDRVSVAGLRPRNVLVRKEQVSVLQTQITLVSIWILMQLSLMSKDLLLVEQTTKEPCMNAGPDWIREVLTVETLLFREQKVWFRQTIGRRKMDTDLSWQISSTRTDRYKQTYKGIHASGREYSLLDRLVRRRASRNQKTKACFYCF